MGTQNVRKRKAHPGLRYRPGQHHPGNQRNALSRRQQDPHRESALQPEFQHGAPRGDQRHQHIGEPKGRILCQRGPVEKILPGVQGTLRQIRSAQRIDQISQHQRKGDGHVEAKAPAQAQVKRDRGQEHCAGQDMAPSGHGKLQHVRKGAAQKTGHKPGKPEKISCFDPVFPPFHYNTASRSSSGRIRQSLLPGSESRKNSSLSSSVTA